MNVIHHAHLSLSRHGAEASLVAADGRRGPSGLEVTIRTLDAGGHGAPQRHAGELVVLVLAGTGKLLIDGAPQRFAGPCTLLIPAGPSFQIVNDSAVALQFICIAAAAPTPGTE